MNRKDFRNLSKQNKLITVDEANRIMYQNCTKLVKKLADDYSAVVAFTLHDKLGFGRTRSHKFLAAVMTMFDDVQAERLSIDDIRKTIEEEIGVVIK